MRNEEIQSYRNQLVEALKSEPDRQERRRILNEARNTDVYDEARVKTMEARVMDEYFSGIFPKKVWPKILVNESPIDPMTFEGSPREVSTKLWESLIPSLDAYIERYHLPFTKKFDQGDEEFFRELVDKMYRLNQKNGEYWDCWPSVAIEDGATNCALGSQIAARVLQRAGFEVEYGMPGPLSHAVVIGKAEDGQRFYLDQTNGVVSRLGPEKHVGGVKAYEIQTDDPRIPFRLVPAFPLEVSVATAVWNLGSLLSKALERNADPRLVKLANRFGLDQKMPYGKWAKKRIFPESLEFSAHPDWLKEKEESSRRIQDS